MRCFVKPFFPVVEVANFIYCYNFCLNLLSRTTGPHQRGHGPDQRRHEGRREEFGRFKQMLRTLCPALE